MANPWRGDVSININGEQQVMRLTLGALAELEETLEERSLVALVERFESNKFAARDVLALLGAGLKGGKCNVTEAELLDADVEGGPLAAARAAAELLARSFVLPTT
ncbi:MAG: gene transfer agent family protein [Roseobacter sp.]